MLIFDKLKKGNMKKVYLSIYLVLLGLVLDACPNITPSFTYTNTHSCGLPGVISITNTSTGSYASSTQTKYLWKVAGKIKDSTWGLTAPSNLLLTTTGVHAIEIVSIDSTGCRDSASSNVTITSNAPNLLGGLGAYTKSPEWLNCIQFRGSNDSFEIKIQSQDTLMNPTIIWGDGTSNSSATKLTPGDSIKHFYTSTGIFTYKVILTNAANTCTDTLYGKVLNQRQPTAGITGPTSGQNRGCAPHTITFKNSSYNVTEETKINWQFGDGETATQNAVNDPDSINHTYKSALCGGIVTLIASNVCGTSQTTWNPIDISEKDKAIIGVDTSNCDPKVPFVFHNQSADKYCSNPDPKQYYWDFGDGVNTGWIFTKASQTHIYKNPGEYTVMLIAKNNCGSDTTYFKFTAIFTPEPNFKITDSIGCSPVKVTVTDISKGWKLTRSWNFGDGTTSIDSIASHTYNVGGDYTLKLTSSNSCGAVDTTIQIRVFDSPIAKLALRGEGCVPYSQSFYNQSTTFSDSTTYLWTFGDGTTSADQKPTAKVYSTPGKYEVTLQVKNSCGVSNDTTEFEAYSYPVISLKGDSTICTFDTFALQISADVKSTFSVNWGDGTTNSYAQDTNGKHAFNQSGLNLIVVTATGPGGCPTKDTFEVDVKPGALSKFTIDKVYGCAPVTFNITDESKNSSNYWWYINDSLVSTASSLNPYTISNDSTLVSIKLKTENAGFCRVDSMIHNIFTANKPSANFTLDDSANCGPLSVSITNTSQGVSTYNWTLGNGITSTLENPQPIYSASKSQDTAYNIQVIGTNWAGCKDTAKNLVVVYPLPTIDFTTNIDKGCGPLSVNFTNKSTPNDTGSIGIMNFDWNLGNGQNSSLFNPSETYLASLTKDSIYAVQLIGTSEHQCKDSISKNITVYPNPTASFTPSVTEGCGPLVVALKNKSIPNDTGSIGIMNFDWTINGTKNTKVNPNSTFIASASKDSTHTVLLIAKSEHGCLDTSIQTILVYPKPKAAFTVNNSEGCTPHTVNITNSSTPFDTGSMNDMTFKWKLGDGTSSTLANPTNIYTSQSNLDSTYSIQLIASSEHSCLDTTYSNVVAHPRPKSDFTLDKSSGCGPLTVNFDAQTINGNDYFWNFGPGWSAGSKTEQYTFNPILLFDTIYRVELTTTSIFGCTGDTISKPLRVQGSPKADFILSKDTSCNEEVTLFYNTSLAAIKYDWTFGDNTSSKLINPSKTFKADNINGKAITYKIKLTATSIFGCADSAIQYFTATPLPQAKISFDNANGCGDLTVNFNNASKFGLTQKWSFGEGSESTDKNPSFVYTNKTPVNKQFVVTLESFASAGCNAIDTATVTVYPSPFISTQASRTNVCDSGRFEFIVSGSNINQLTWNFGDGSTKENSITSPSPYIHYFPLSTYADTSYTVNIIATSNYGCKDSTLKAVNLVAKVIANFDQTPNSACVPASATFTNLSRNATNYVWEFGDGGGSGDVNPSYIYNTPGTYSIKLTAFDKNGCKSIKTGTDNFVARETPIAEFAMTPGQLKLPDAKAIFSNLSIYKSPTQFEWDFGDGSPVSFQDNPTHSYGDTGSYKVKLLAKNNSCQDVIIKQIIVDPSLPIVNFDPEGAVGCAPLTVQFKEKTLNANQLTWYFGDGQSSTNPNPVHVYENDGFYTVTLIAEGPGGTSRIIETDIIEVKVTPRCYFYASPDSAHLPNARFDMDNRTINANSYAWEINKSDNQLLVGASALKNPSFIINEVGNYDVTLRATNTNQCHDTLVKPLLLIVLEQGHIYIPSAFTPNRDNINDQFKPVMIGVSEQDYTFRIYNRWGAKIFETNNNIAGWDGTINEQLVAESVFVWTISGKFADGTFFNKKGTVTLLR